MELEGNRKYLYLLMTQAAVRMKKLNKNKKDFVLYSEEIWDSMEMNNLEELEKIIYESMLNDNS